MKRTRRLTVYMLILLIVSLTGCTDTKTSTTEAGVKTKNKEIQSRLEKFMDSCVTNLKFNGTVLVAKNEQVLLENGYGMADDDNHIPNTTQTVYEIGSITKQFTATAILMLKEKGLINIQDTIDKYISNYPNGNKIKIYNLLNHTSGIPEYLKYVESMEPGKRCYTPKELIELFEEKPLDFEPGTNFQYSNSNYILLGYIIEKLTGKSYEDYIKNNIFKPIKMRHTDVLNSKTTVNGMAVGYSYLNPKPSKKAGVFEPTLPYAAGEIYSTVEDLLLWNNNLCNGKFINKNSLKEMFTPGMNSYGFGWFASKTNGDDLIFHGGNTLGFSSYIERNINKGYVVIVLSNIYHDDNPKFIGDQLLQIVSSN